MDLAFLAGRLHCAQRLAQSRVMLTPRFTLRRLFLIVAVCAVLALVPTFAAEGHLWILCLAMAAIGAVLLAVFSAIGYAIVRLLAVIIQRNQMRVGQVERS
jgi:hypothetical protein